MNLINVNKCSIWLDSAFPLHVTVYDVAIIIIHELIDQSTYTVLCYPGDSIQLLFLTMHSPHSTAEHSRQSSANWSTCIWITLSQCYESFSSLLWDRIIMENIVNVAYLLLKIGIMLNPLGFGMNRWKNVFFLHTPNLFGNAVDAPTMSSLIRRVRDVHDVDSSYRVRVIIKHSCRIEDQMGPLI